MLTLVDRQGAEMSNNSGNKLKDLSESRSNGAGNRSGAGHRPTLRLSHVQHSTKMAIHKFSAKPSVERSKYHEAVSKKTESRFNEQLTKTLVAPLDPSRDEKAEMRPSSLAATHPAQYNRKTAQANATSATYSSLQFIKTESLSPKKESKPICQAPREVPWRTYTDPMWQTSSDPYYWTTNRTILKSESNTDHGNVVSPTWMIGLPFGSMTEMADPYSEVNGHAG